MPGSMFFHLQTFSRKANPAGQSVDQVVGEAVRDPEFSGHVLAPLPPRPLMGDPQAFLAAHEAHVAARATQVRTKGHGVRSRAIRADRHTLLTAVASYPVAWDQLDALPEGRARLADWEARTVAWARDRWGDQLRVVLAHDDEAHPHLHLWCLPDDAGADATTLHPGKAAKAKAESDAKRAGRSARDAVAEGNKALKAAMVELLDDYWREVGVPCGLTRDGPRRTRLTRAEHQARQVEAERLRTVQLEAEAEAGRLDDGRLILAAEREELDERDAELREVEADLAHGALDLGRERERVQAEAREVGRAEGLALGRAEAAAELHELRDEARAVRHGFKTWLPRLLADPLGQQLVPLLRRLGVLLGRLDGSLSASGVDRLARQEPTEEPCEEPGPAF